MLVCKDLKNITYKPCGTKDDGEILVDEAYKKITYKPYGTEDGELLVCKEFLKMYYLQALWYQGRR